MYRMKLKLKSFDLHSLKQAENLLFFILSFLNVYQIQQKTSPKKCKKVTVLRSPHIDKKSREQYQLVNHKKTFMINVSDKNVTLLLLEILKNCQLLGVELEISLEYSTF